MLEAVLEAMRSVASFLLSVKEFFGLHQEASRDKSHTANAGATTFVILKAELQAVERVHQGLA